MLGGVFQPFVDFFIILILSVLGLSFLFAVVFITTFFALCHVNPLKPNIRRLRRCKLVFTPYDLIRWMWLDWMYRRKCRYKFPDFGFTFYVGRQGHGKTISMVYYLKRMKEKYPNCIIVANFQCKYVDYLMKDWRDILTVRNGKDGVIFAIDEIHSEYSAANWKDVPENLLSEVSQQRKQRVKIIASAQYYCRIAKPLREQGFTVTACTTRFKGRLTSCKVYDAEQYARVLESATGLSKLKPVDKYSFVQSDSLRSCYDTYEKITLMQKIKFIPRNER